MDQPGRPLDNAARGFMEPAFGHDFSRVRVHPDVRFGVAPGTVQCQGDEGEKKKVESKFSQDTGFSLNPDAVKNKFAFTGELTIPLFPDAKRGSVLFLDELNIKGEASKETETSLKNPVKLPQASDIDSLQAEAALSLIHMELPKLKGRMGELGVDAKFEATRTLQQNFGSGGMFSSKFGGKATVGAEYKSRALGGPAATLFGILGDKATVSVGGEGTFSDEIEKKKAANVRMGASATLGLTGTGKDEPFVKIKFGGEGALDLKNGGIDPASKATIVEISIGFKIGARH